MKFARIKSFQLDPSGASVITVDVEKSGAESGIRIVGLPDKAVQESCARVLAALRNTKGAKGNDESELGYITISLSPADIQKTGPSFDLPIAVGLLVTSGVIRADVSNMVFIGELGLSGDVRSIRGALAAALEAKRRNISALFVPKQNAKEAALVAGVPVYGIETLADLIGHFASLTETESHYEIFRLRPAPHEQITNTEHKVESFVNIRGQHYAKRALAIAAAGGHHIALFGPPGTGKSMLSRAFTEILPPLQEEELIESTMIHSLAGVLKTNYLETAPLRSPHHTSSHVAIVGGGPNIRPGEITLAHNGVLFLDEFPEFDTKLIEALREPLETGVVHISRAKGSHTYPARFQLIAAMNPCPCGFRGDRERRCTCSPASLEKYNRKLSGPIVDRIDLWVNVPRATSDEMLKPLHDAERRVMSEEAERLRFAACNAHRIAIQRQGVRNAQLPPGEIEKHAVLTHDGRALLAKAADLHHLSARALHRTIRVARTIADMRDSSVIENADLIEALQYRSQIPG